MPELSNNVLCVPRTVLLSILLAVLMCWQMVRAETDCVSAGCCCVGEVGNVDCDPADIVDVADLTRLIDHLFISMLPLDNRAEANIDGDPATEIDINDLTRLIDHLFISHQPLPDCPAPANTPPRTVITIPDHSPASPYINSESAGHPEAGVAFAWYGFDKADHPYTSPSFSYEWRLYGPYPRNAAAESYWPMSEEPQAGDTIWENLCREFVREIYRRMTGELYETGNGLTYIVCDTSYVPLDIDPTGKIIVCDTVLVDTITQVSPEGWFDTVLAVDDPVFSQDPQYNRIVTCSNAGETSATNDSSVVLYDLFRSAPQDSTVEMVFLFWVRSLDPLDLALVDPTPPIRPVLVVEPKAERDMLIIDGQLVYEINSCHVDTAKQYWRDVIADWAQTTGSSVSYDDSIDFLDRADVWDDCPGLLELLRHKAVIVLNDNPFAGLASSRQFITDLYRATRFRLNVWFAGRAMFYGGEALAPNFNMWDALAPVTVEFLSEQIGLTNIVYSGWEHHIYYNDQRIEDFVGAISVDNSIRPDLVVDSALLHSRYQWINHYPWVDSLAALPEVSYLSVDSTADILYEYESRFGPDHWLPDTNYNFDGRAVAVRKESTQSRSAYWMFTPYSLESSAMRLAVHEMLSWLLLNATDSMKVREQR